MWYVLESTVSASTAKANATETSIKVSGGILHTIYVTIPPGSASLVHCQLRKGGYYILPRNEDKDISGELASVKFNEFLELKHEMNRLTLKTWNTDDTYDHKVTLLIGVLPKKVMEMEEEIIKDLRLFLRLFRRRT